jgi:hypothetical protein
MIDSNNIPALAELEAKAISIFLAHTIGGSIQKKPEHEIKALALLARLIDKAKFEYLQVRDAIIKQEQENKLSIEEIIRRDQGQFIFTIQIINNLENCINTLGKIQKLMPLIDLEHKSERREIINKMRNSIEHIDHRITQNVTGSLSLAIYDESLTAEITDQRIKFVDLAEDIRIHYNIIIQHLQS